MTPIRRQYLQIKRQYPDAILFFRLGDFYETFDQDAKVVARELEIALTSRPMGKNLRVPLAGIPYHALDSYLARLIRRGYKVAICEQLSDPTSRGPLERGVVRVVTPGTVLEPNILEARSNNYLAALAPGEREWGLSYLDITTGEFATTQALPGRIGEELERLQPAELLVPGKGVALPTPAVGRLTPVEEAWFDPEPARETLLEHFGVVSLEGYGCAHLPQAVGAAGAVLRYVEATQRAVLPQLVSLTTYATDSFMALDLQTRRNLELLQSARQGGVPGSLVAILDLTETAPGARLLKRWLHQPLLELEAIQGRQALVEAFFSSSGLRSRVRSLLGRLPDLERLVNRIASGVGTPREVVALRRGLEVVPELEKTLSAEGPSVASGADHPWSALRDRVRPCPQATQLIARALVDDPPAALSEGGVIRPGYAEELESLRAAAQSAREYVAGLERQERERTGIRSLKVGYNKVFGYYIEVSHAHRREVPADYLRKQTLVGAERYITPQLKDYETIILNAQERSQELERDLFRQVCQQIGSMRGQILGSAAALAEMDVLAALAEVASRYGYCRPQVTRDDEIVIEEGRHPVVERSLQEEPFVPNDTHLSNHDTQIMVLTGPNMAGKSTYLRQVALIVLLAQIGGFVPARKARIGLVDRIYTRVGAQDDLAAGESTFMVEMLETANILNHATPRSLIVLDEIGRGTSTYDGLAIARAVLEHIHQHPRLGCKTLFATHYHELTELADTLSRVKNYNVAVVEEEGRVVFLRRILAGGCDRSYGVHVARLAGLPPSVLDRATALLEALEQRNRDGGAPGALPPDPRSSAGKVSPFQLPLFRVPPPLVEELLGLDLDSLTPLQALNKLSEFQAKARGGEG